VEDYARIARSGLGTLPRLRRNTPGPPGASAVNLLLSGRHNNVTAGFNERTFLSMWNSRAGLFLSSAGQRRLTPITSSTPGGPWRPGRFSLRLQPPVWYSSIQVRMVTHPQEEKIVPAYCYQCTHCQATECRIGGLDDHLAVCTRCWNLMLRLDYDLFAPYFKASAGVAIPSDPRSLAQGSRA